MAVESTNVGASSARDAGGTAAADLIEELTRFDGPPEVFLATLLAVQCRLARAAGGAILGPGAGGTGEVLALHPLPAQDQAPPPWVAELSEPAQRAAASGATVVRPLRGPHDMYGQPANRHVIVVPLRRGGQNVRAVAAYLVETGDRAVLAAAQERIELTVSLLSLYEARLALQRRGADLERLRMATEVLAAVNEHERFAGAAMTLCNEVTSRWPCDRTSLGFLKGRYVQLKALSNTEKFSRKMKLVQDIESAMEECLDQDVEVTHPAPVSATFVSRSAADLAGRHGPTAVLSLPLRHEGKPVAVLTAERPADKPFTLGEAETLRLTCNLCTARVRALHASDRWFGARAAGGLRATLAMLLGARHTWIKLIVLAIVAGVLFVTFGKGDFDAEAPFKLLARQRQVVPAQFDGRIDRVYVEPNDPVIGAGAGKPTWLLKPNHLTDPSALVETLRTDAAQDRGPARHMLDLLDRAEGEDLRHKLNALLAHERFCTPRAWDDIADDLPQRTKDLLSDLDLGPLRQAERIELNRSLLSAAYPKHVAPGPTVLATLKTDELRMELATRKGELAGYVKQRDAALDAVGGRGTQVDVQLAQAKVDEVTAKINLLKHRIAQAVLVSAIDGYVAQGDLKRQLGAPVETGDQMFLVVSDDEMLAELSVPEDLIADVRQVEARAEREGWTVGGELAATARPETKVKFSLERINPVAEVVDQKNVFMVRVKVMDLPEILRRPGVEGVARIHIGRRSIGYIWTRRLINWFRMKFWL